MKWGFICLPSAQKAGIFKPGVPAFAVAQRTADADRILQEVAEDVGAPFEQLHPSQLATMAASASHSELELGLPGMWSTLLCTQHQWAPA